MRLNIRELVSLLLALLLLHPLGSRLNGQRIPARPLPRNQRGIALQIQIGIPGQSRTLLADGSILLLGGVTTAPINAALRNGELLAPKLINARAYHTATVLPDGSVFVFGGLDRSGTVRDAEQFDPVRRTFSPLVTNLQARSGHTATLLINGKVLIIGGAFNKALPTGAIEIWDPREKSSQVLPLVLAQPRRDHRATLQADGTVRIEGGTQVDGSPARWVEVVDPHNLTLATGPSVADPESRLLLSASTPSDNSFGVPSNTVIGLRFSRRMRLDLLNSATVTLRDERGPMAARVAGAESGRLAFITPDSLMEAGASYIVEITGALDEEGFSLAPVKVNFTVEAESRIVDDARPLETSPNVSARRKDTGEDPILTPLRAQSGVTALSGQVHTVGGKYLAGVTLELNCGEQKARRNRTTSDRSGRFLLQRIPSGHCELGIDGRTANDSLNSYGAFKPAVEIAAGVTNVLPYIIWMTPLDTAHEVTIPSPTIRETIVSNPSIPGLELRLPAGTTILDEDGNPVHKLSLTQIPISRPPFPLPAGVPVPLYFTIQPNGYIYGPDWGGAQLYYPNRGRAPAGYKFTFWRYDHRGAGWQAYGAGSVSANRKYIAPDEATFIYELNGAMVAPPNQAAPGGPGGLGGWNGDGRGDPVDPSTGTFVYSAAPDFSIADVQPLKLVRTYRQGDPVSHAFGIGINHNYDVYVVGDINPYTYIDVIWADGSRTHFDRISPHGSPDYLNAVFQTKAPNGLYMATISWNGGGWSLRLRDGSVWKFRDGFSATLPFQSGLLSVEDRFGNTTTLSRDSATGRLLKVQSLNGRWISFAYDSSNRVTQAVDNNGRTYTYTYDIGGRLITVQDPLGGFTDYTYDANNQMLTITDARGITYLTNQYDNIGRVSQQTLADGGVWHFDYTTDANDNIVQTDVTNPRGFVERITYNTNGYFSGGQIVSSTQALGEAVERTISSGRDATTGLVTSQSDSLSRQTSYTYDACANVTGITRLAGTGNAVTTTMTYQTGSGSTPCTSTFNQLTSITDPLSHMTTFGYDGSGKSLTSVTDPLGHAVTIASNSAGQPTSMTTFAGTTQFSYTNGDLSAIVDGVSNTTQMTVDSLGRVKTVRAPLGQLSQYSYDAFNNVVQLIDAANQSINFTYDENGNPLTVQDARGNTTTYTPDVMDRATSRQDALLHTETTLYDLNGNPSTFTDRKSQVTSNTYDALDRLTLVTYADSSTTAFTYDAGDRLTQIVDSVSGTITRTYDDLDRLTSETTPQGTVSYTYDAADRRATLTVAGQSAVTYTYDDADRLTQIAQGGATVAFGYDNANRRTSLTLPNGITATYGYDTVSRLTGITYSQGAAAIGNLTYIYDGNGQRIGMGGSLANTGLPAAISSATYNANNQLTNWNGTAVTYDLNGNMTNDGSTGYTWDTRNQLASAGAVGFAYDTFGRRILNASGKSFLYDGPNTVQELTSSTPTANLLTGGVDEIFRRTDAAGARDFLSDALGSTIGLADSSGTLQTHYSYEPFGNTTAGGTSSANTFQYTGRENDGTGLYYYRARYFNPTLQRFISEDPAEFSGGSINLHSYVGNSAPNFSDPSGECLPTALIGAGVGLAAYGFSHRKNPTWGGAIAWGGMGAAAGCGVGLAASRIAAIAARRAATEDIVSLFHQGILRNGQVSSSRSLSTSLSKELTHYNPAGKLNEFHIPRSVFNKWMDNGWINKLRDLHGPTGIITEEIRVLPPASGLLNQFLVP